MTTTDMTTDEPPVAPAQRVLRRSRTDRVGAGVAGGLGEYFGVDPVLFRVLFATAAFFGGAGILAYLIAWAAIPEAGTAHAPIDGWIRAVRRRRIPSLLFVVLGVFVLWALAFSWWAPGPFFPVMLIVIVLFALFVRRDARAAGAVDEPAAPVDLTKPASASTPTWVGDTRQWITESREAHRIRRRRAMPVRLATLGVLLAALVVLGLVDAASGIQLRAYFFATAGIVGLGLLVGLVLRRTPWSVALLLVPAVLGSVAFGGSTASLHDGSGQRSWTPTSSLPANYRLAFGDAVLDLRSLKAPTSPQTVNITMAGGRLQIVAPPTMNLAVDAHLRFGQVQEDGIDKEHGSSISQVVEPLARATGAPITLDVHLATGLVEVDHR